MIQNYLNGACWEMGVGVHTNRMLRRYFVAAHTSLWAQKTRRLGSVDFNTFCVRRTLCKVGILLSIMQIVVFILFIVFFCKVVYVQRLLCCFMQAWQLFASVIFLVMLLAQAYGTVNILRLKT